MSSPTAALERPRFHFCAPTGWINDPNGFVFYEGRYHLFFQYAPDTCGHPWGKAPIHWGHAASADLLHWEHLPLGLTADAQGNCFSGTAAIDEYNTSGFGADGVGPVVGLYTATNSGQRLFYANGPQCQPVRLEGEPVLLGPGAAHRDPKLFWYGPDEAPEQGHWVMVLYHSQPGFPWGWFVFYTSRDLREWKIASRLQGWHECPDLFQLPLLDVNGHEIGTRWVLYGADGTYLTGDFDGFVFTPDSSRLMQDWGRNFYAAQTCSRMPNGDRRRIQIAWMAEFETDFFKGLPFNQQLSVPCELSLHLEGTGLRLRRMPIREIERLHGKRWSYANLDVIPGTNPLADLRGELWDIETEFAIGTAEVFGLTLGGTLGRVFYNVSEGMLFNGLFGQGVPLPAEDGRIRLRILKDTHSLEVFANDGRVSITNCLVRTPDEPTLNLWAIGGAACAVKLSIRELK